MTETDEGAVKLLETSFLTTTKTYEKFKSTLTNDMLNMHTWCDEKNMVVNLEKTKAMFVSTHQKPMRLKSSLELFNNETKVEITNSEKLLGVIIDKNILSTFHIDKLAPT